MDASHNQIKRTNHVNAVRPDFSAFNEIWEQKRRGTVESLANLAYHSAAKAGILGAIVALSYIAGKIVEAGSELTPLALLGALVVAAMIVAIVVTVFIVEIRSNAQINKKSFTQSAESTDERQCPKEAGKASRRN
jgi:hypothetical protein